MGECTVEGCQKISAAKGLCHTHYRRMCLYGDPSIVKQPHIRGMSEYCRVQGCSKKSIAKSLCVAHYAKLRKYGDPNVVKHVQFHGLTLEERFWKRVVKSPKCWLWNGYRDPKGYGRLMIDGNPVLASRLSWHLHYGDIPCNKDGDAAYVLHKCDNPSCVNPNHLYLGDSQDNMDDMWSRGRAKPGHLAGEKHGMAKLTEIQVREIRATRGSHTEIARKFGVSVTTVCDIRNRRVWKHLK